MITKVQNPNLKAIFKSLAKHFVIDLDLSLVELKEKRSESFEFLVVELRYVDFFRRYSTILVIIKSRK